MTGKSEESGFPVFVSGFTIHLIFVPFCFGGECFRTCHQISRIVTLVVMLWSLLTAYPVDPCHLQHRAIQSCRQMAVAGPIRTTWAPKRAPCSDYDKQRSD